MNSRLVQRSLEKVGIHIASSTAYVVMNQFVAAGLLGNAPGSDGGNRLRITTKGREFLADLRNDVAATLDLIDRELGR